MKLSVTFGRIKSLELWSQDMIGLSARRDTRMQRRGRRGLSRSDSETSPLFFVPYVGNKNNSQRVCLYVSKGSATKGISHTIWLLVLGPCHLVRGSLISG